VADSAGTWATVDGNEAAARVAFPLSEVIAIYPITPASPMGELSDAWSAAGRTNLWGSQPEVVEMQSEGGAAGALHGAVQKGALGTTFTASQGLLLMLPNMFKIAGELTPAVVHVAARTVATHALSIFGDHSDVMAARTTGWAMLAASSVQEAHDFALVAHAATLRTRVPFLHFFDGFRTSHEIDKIRLLSDEDLRALVREEDVLAHRMRGLSPDRPVLRGSAQNPDVFFQAREAGNPFQDAVPTVVQQVMDELRDRTGRAYHLVDYSTCIAHGIDMATSMTHQKAAVASGYWPLYRYHPSPVEGAHPFQLDAKRPTLPLREFARTEARFSMLARSRHLLALAQADVDERWHYYEQLAGEQRSVPQDAGGPAIEVPDGDLGEEPL